MVSELDQKVGVHDKLFAEKAFDLAEEALSVGEVPVGCVLVYDGLIIGHGRNRVNQLKNATRHAELEAIDMVLEWHRNRKNSNRPQPPLDQIWPLTELYVTVEPCIMCARVLRHLRLKRVLFGCSNERFGGCGSVLNIHETNEIKEEPVLETMAKHLDHTRAVYMLQSFYMGENPNAPCPKIKTRNRIKIDCKGGQ